MLITHDWIMQPVCWRYVVEEYEHGRSLDHHWMTFNDLCRVCDLDYNYIVKVETMSVDAERLLPTLLQQDVAALSKSWKRSADIGRLPQLLPTLNHGNSNVTIAFARKQTLVVYITNIVYPRSTFNRLFYSFRWMSCMGNQHYCNIGLNAI